MVTIGLGEGLAVTSLLIQLVETGQKCADTIQTWKHFGQDASDLYLRFNHEQRKLAALKDVLTNTGKFGQAGPLFEQMSPEPQNDLLEMLLRIFSLLDTFQKLVSRFVLDGATSDLLRLNVSSLEAVALESSLPDSRARIKTLQHNIAWTKKFKWVVGGRADAQKVVAGLRAWLILISEVIEQQIGNLPIIHLETTLDRLSLLEHDPDLIALQLQRSVRVRRLVLELNYPSNRTAETLRKELYIESSQIHLGPPVGVSRNEATLSEHEEVLVDFKGYLPDDERTRTQIERLGQLLAEPKDETFHLPQLAGIYHEEHLQRYGFIFRATAFGLDNLSSLWTLDQAMRFQGRPQGLRKVPLEVRYKLAASLATAVARFHSVGWYHEGLQSGNIYIAASTSTPSVFDRLFLLGFTKSRMIDGQSVGDPDPSTYLYQHPDRWGITSSKAKFAAVHELYSLGVVLMEIGLWKSVSEAFGNERSIIDIVQTDVRKRLLAVARATLSPVMGTRYQEIVISLIESHHPGESDPQHERNDSCARRLRWVIGVLNEVWLGLTAESEANV